MLSFSMSFYASLQQKIREVGKLRKVQNVLNIQKLANPIFGTKVLDVEHQIASLSFLSRIFLTFGSAMVSALLPMHPIVLLVYLVLVFQLFIF